jgi:hypothetical protein
MHFMKWLLMWTPIIKQSLKERVRLLDREQRMFRNAQSFPEHAVGKRTGLDHEATNVGKLRPVRLDDTTREGTPAVEQGCHAERCFRGELRSIWRGALERCAGLSGRPFQQESHDDERPGADRSDEVERTEAREHGSGQPSERTETHQQWSRLAMPSACFRGELRLIWKGALERCAGLPRRALR